MSTFAQIQGIVKDAAGEPLIGVSVIEKRTTIGVVTDVSGHFNINASSESLLKFSSVG